MAPFSETPAASVSSTTAKTGWPEGAYEFKPGVWYVPYKGAQGGPFGNPVEAVYWMNAVDARDANNANANYKADGRGSFPVGQLTANDAAYLRSVVGRYVLMKQNGDIFRDVLAGSHDDINRAIELGDRTNPGGNEWKPDNPAVAVAVGKAMAQARG